MSTRDKQVSVSFEIDKNRANALQKAFPEHENIQELATTVAQIITNELIDLLAGQRRYLSLSHQYIEWIQQLYEALLPNEEYTYERLYDKFNFPPGTATYMARVLRARQNTTLHTRALTGLKDKLSKELQKYEEQKDPQPGQKMRSVRLTAREYDILKMVVGRLFSRELLFELPFVTSRSKEIVIISYDVDSIRAILPELDNLI
jgi:hypothetical protein